MKDVPEVTKMSTDQKAVRIHNFLLRTKICPHQSCLLTKLSDVAQVNLF